MLTYKVGKENIKMEPTPLNVSSITWNETDAELILIAPNHKLHSGESVMFTRSDGSEINFRKSLGIKEIVDRDTLKLYDFDVQFVTVSSAATYNFQYHPDYGKRKFIGLFTTEDEQHDVLENRDDVVIRERIYGNNPAYEIDTKHCDGDYVLYEDKFLYQVLAGEDKYIFPESADTCLNARTDVYIVPTEDLAALLAARENQVGNTWEYNGEVLILHNCIVPSKLNGHDDRTKFLWMIEDEEIASRIEENLPELTFYVRDERFIYPTEEVAENGLICAQKAGVSILNPQYAVVLSDAVLQDFGTNLLQTDLLQTEYIDKIIEEAKNHIIDYEKQCFTPIYLDGDKKCDIREIFFNLHFREREAQWDSDLAACSYGEWKTNDNLFWNGYKYNGGASLTPVPSTRQVNESDMLGYLGFTDNDIYYRRSRVSRSFLRLMFFDTPDRRTQSLLHTSVIYLNSGALYEKYVADVRHGKKKGKICEDAEPEFVYTEDAPKRLDATLSCKNKYESTNSSEGFYIYLFPGILDENGAATIYLKAEFNHAKYGYTLPFIMPMTENGIPVLPTSPDFPRDYVSVKNGNEYVNTTKLFGDMYIPIKVEFDTESSRYVWYVESALQENGIANFNLFEPKINKMDGINASLEDYTIGWRGGEIHGRVEVGVNKLWTVDSKSDEIISITPSSGYGSTDIVVNVSANTEEEQRTLFATFYSSNSYATVEIEQDATDFELTLTPIDRENPIMVSWHGEDEIYIDLSTNEDTEWRVTAVRGDITMDVYAGTGPHIFNLSVDAPTVFDIPSQWGFSVQDVNGYGAPRTIDVIVAGVPTAGIGVEPTDFEAVYEGDEFTLEISDPRSIGWEVISNYDWISVDSDRGYGNAELNVDINSNLSLDNRYAQLTVRFGRMTRVPSSDWVRQYVNIYQERDCSIICYIGDAYAVVNNFEDDNRYSYTIYFKAWFDDNGAKRWVTNCSRTGTTQNGQEIWWDQCFEGADVTDWHGTDKRMHWDVTMEFFDGARGQTTGSVLVSIPDWSEGTRRIPVQVNLGAIELHHDFE